MILKGFRFGSLLQLAVGPVCIFIFNTSINSGILAGLSAVLGAYIIDSLYILLSIVGIYTLLKEREQILKWTGVVILMGFGIMTIYNALSSSVDTTRLVEVNSPAQAFILSVILTSSSPLTILFWSGVFSTKVIEEKYTKKDQILFGIGAALTTPVYQGIVVFIGQFTSRFLSTTYISVLNCLVGVILIIFALRLLISKRF